MSLIEHLDELRVRLIRFLVVFFLCLLATYGLRKEILDVIRAPVEEPLQRYAAAAKAPKVIDGRPQIADLDDYQCSCTRNPRSATLSPPTPSPAPPEQLTPEFPLASSPPVTVKSQLELIQEPEQWKLWGEQLYKDFLAFYYSSTGRPEKAAEIFHGETQAGQPPEAESYYEDTETLVLELNCRCVAEKAKSNEGAMVYIGLPELFFAQMKVAIYSAIFLSFPYLLVQLWGFVGPALYKDEKKVFWGFGISTFVFFLGGASFGYFVVFPFGFDFFLSLSQPGEIMPNLSIGEYLDFTVKLFLAFGLIFELPVAVFILARLGILTPQLMISQARPALVVITVLSAVLTPPDPFTMLLMAGPLTLLYLLSIGVCFVAVNRKKAAMRAQGLNPEEFEDL
ncbi:MAG: twin-arginine translocase subunit TatC [bacterium]|nr:twin-arginine translocase subunit TatC [bacterium]